MPFGAVIPRKNPQQPAGWALMNQPMMSQPPQVPYQQNPNVQQGIQYPAQSGFGYPQQPAVVPMINNPGYPGMEQQMQMGYPQQSINASMPSAPTFAHGSSQYMTPMRRINATLVPFHNFDPCDDADKLRKAMKGMKTDEASLINILCRRSYDQRMEIVKTYARIYARNLTDDIKSETSGNFQSVLVGLLKTKVDLYCSEISTSKKADILIDVVCLMTDEEIREISHEFQKVHAKSLNQQIHDTMSGNLANFILKLAETKNQGSVDVDITTAQVDARILKDAINKFFKEESKVVQVFSKGYEHIRLVSQEYGKLVKSTLEKDIESKFSGDFRQALLAILSAGNQPAHFARRLHKSMVGLGTDDKSLIRLCITRCEIDMMDIKQEFQKLFNDSLKSFIEGDTSGDYMKALLALCGEN